jgi:hypothetical protein
LQNLILGAHGDGKRKLETVACLSVEEGAPDGG